MQIKIRTMGGAIAFALLLSCATAVRGQTPQTLYFAASGNPLNYNWFSGGNWYRQTIDKNGNPIKVVCGCLPGTIDTAVLNSAVAVPGSVHVHELDVVGSNTPSGATVTGGDITVDILSLRGGSNTDANINMATVHVTAQMVATGPLHNALNGTTLIIQPGAALRLDPDTSVPPKGGALILGAGTTVFNQGQIVMTDKSSIVGEATSSAPCMIQNVGAGTLSSSGIAFVGIISGDFTFDNNGNVRADTGTLTFGSGITWLSTQAKAGNFIASAAGATLVLTSFSACLRA